jgi:hypothetical protein
LVRVMANLIVPNRFYPACQIYPQNELHACDTVPSMLYHLTRHGCDVRNQCTSGKHWHTIKPHVYDPRRFGPGWVGWIASCDGDLEDACRRVREATAPQINGMA